VRVADDPYIAKDACEAIDVEYEPLPVVVNRRRRPPRTRRSSGRQGNQDGNLIYNWEVGTPRAPTGLRGGGPGLAAPAALPEVAPSRSSAAAPSRLQPVHVEAHRLHDDQAPHIIRAAVALVAELPEHMIDHLPDIAALRNKVPSIRLRLLDPGLHPAGAPVKWIETRRGPDLHRLRADVYLDGELALRRDGKILGMRMRTLADHGAFFADASQQVQDRPDALNVRLL